MPPSSTARRGNGRAFITRTCFNAAGYSYTNKFVTFPELVALKGTDVAPLGSVPSLTLPSGRTVVQSAALARFAAKKAEIYPRDDDEAALLIDEIFETALEFANKVPQTPDKEASPRAAVAAIPTRLTLTLAFFFTLPRATQTAQGQAARRVRREGVPAFPRLPHEAPRRRALLLWRR